MDRRKFIKAAGGTAALGVAGKLTFEAVAAGEMDKLAHSENSGIRWAMVIDIKKFHETGSGEKCARACNDEHNVPEFDKDSKDAINWIWTEPFEHAFVAQENHEVMPEYLKKMRIALMCNHCDSAPCVQVCPPKATWKREDGIVMMDWHRCIGCRYCIAACPYGSRSFNWRDPIEAKAIKKIES